MVTACTLVSVVTACTTTIQWCVLLRLVALAGVDHAVVVSDHDTDTPTVRLVQGLLLLITTPSHGCSVQGAQYGTAEHADKPGYGRISVLSVGVTVSATICGAAPGVGLRSVTG